MQGNSGGSASSAAKHRRSGVADHSVSRVYIAGEGWIRWSEIKAQFAAAYEQWRIRRAMAGKMTWDGAEARQANIDESKARKNRISETGSHPSQKANDAAGAVRK